MANEREFVGAAAPEQHRSSVPPDLSPGLRIAGKYELRRKIGSGAMGEVWAAKHVSLEEEVAIKLVLRDVAHGDGSSADSRFLLEARVASQLSRKTRHIVSVTDHGEHGPYAYLAMELLRGESLEARLARTGPMPLEKVVPLVYQVARALAVAHADGIVHRDLKPSNVFVTVDEEGRALVKILDFGIAKRRTSASRLPVAGETAEGTLVSGRVDVRGEAMHATLHGFLLGTPAYMSPEQASGRPLDHRADVWALAVIAYHLLTTEFPFDGETPEEMLLRLCRVRPVPITTHRQDLPPAVVDLFARAFARHANDRFQSAVAFAGALEHATTFQRARGSAPKPLDAISLPPPGDRTVSERPRAPSDRPAPAPSEHPHAPSEHPHAPNDRPAPAPELLETSIVAAGVPRRMRLWPRLVAAALVLAVLLGTASTLSLYFERDAAKSSGLARTAPPAPTTPRALTSRRDDIPPPDPAEATLAVLPADLPAAPPIPPSPSAAPFAPPPPSAAPFALPSSVLPAAAALQPPERALTTAASLPPTAPPPPSPVLHPRASLDRSEVF